LRVKAKKLLAAVRFAAVVARNDLQAYFANVQPRVRYLDLAWCNPLDIRLSTRYFVPKKGGFLHSGNELAKDMLGENRYRFIAAGDWDKDIAPIEDVKHISRTIARFDRELDWESVGEVSWMMENIDEFGVQDGCRNLGDVMARCEAIDALKDQLVRDHRLCSRRELHPRNFREKGGIGVSLARNGDIIWQTDGAHRLALARLLALKEVPVCIHMIHSEGLASGKWSRNIYLQRRY
jgi:hypothetical protein